MQNALVELIQGGGKSSKPVFPAFGAHKGFTLAEVLITLGIIGVVAALLIPGFLSEYQKKITAVKVYKFYSMINQAVRRSVFDNGEPDYWIYPGGVRLGSGGAANINYENNYKFVNQYIAPYIKFDMCENWKVSESGAEDASLVMCHLPAGDAVIFGVYHMGREPLAFDIYYISNFKASKFDSGAYLTDASKVFYFSLQKPANNGTEDGTKSSAVKNRNFVVPYVLNWDGTYEGLTKPGTKYSCSDEYTFYPAYCTKLLELNNWKFPDNYPW